MSPTTEINVGALGLVHVPTTTLPKVMLWPSHVPLRLMEAPWVGELGTSRVHVMSSSEVVNVTCSPVGPPSLDVPLIGVAS
jgi:hypothetical protein